jgi:asparagine synthase (glutamine-hydrolysing)
VCGIAGCIAAPGAAPDRDALERMADALRHRGPDDRGIEVVGQVGLVHTRLAIVDPTPAGRAPMSLDGGRWWLTYNGEVFNHLELRARLGERPWRGGSDTETVLHALAEWGEDAPARCNGLFALAALDAERRRVLLVRDRFGVKPLYLARHGGGLWFASEVGALLAAGVPRRARLDVLRHSIGYGWAEGRLTPIEGVERLAPGTLTSVDLATLEVAERRWYEPAQAVDPERAAALASRPRRDLAGELERELRASVRRRLMADVPVGTMCSGGLDSSLVTAFARDEHPRIVAYNASVADQPWADEGPWARRVADGLGVELRTARLDGAAWRAGLVDAVAHNEHPLMHESSVPMAMIAALARADGVKVLLSGEGADELFAGYDFLHADAYRALLPAPARARQRLELARGRVGGLASRRGRGLGRAVRRRLVERPAAGAVAQPPRAPSAAEWGERVAERAAAAYAHHPGPGGALEAALLGDLSLYLPHLLNRQDKNTMQASVETRVPFLDPAVVALAVNLPLEARTRPLRKGVLRDLGHAHLPRGVARRAKVGFGFDVRLYLEGAARPRFLGEGMLRETLGVDAATWRETVARAASHQALRLWSGEVWCRLFLDARSREDVAAELWLG